MNSANFIPTSNLYIKMVFILNSQSCDLKNGGIFSNYCEVIILSIKSLARLKDQLKSLVYKMFINEKNFHRLFDVILKVMFSFVSRVLYAKSADFLAKNVRCRSITSYVTQPRDRSSQMCWTPVRNKSVLTSIWWFAVLMDTTIVGHFWTNCTFNTWDKLIF